MTPTPLTDTKRLLLAHARPLVLLTLLIYGPFFLVYKGAVGLAALPAEAADTLFGLVGGLLAPLVNGAMVYLLSHAEAGVRLKLTDAVRGAAGAFGRLLTSYIIISVIFLFWVAVPMLPALAFMGFGNLSPQYMVLLAPLALPAVYVISRYAFVDAATVLEGRESQGARFRSIDLAKPRRLRLAANSLLVMLIPTVLDFGADPAASYAERYLSLPAAPVSFLLNLLSALTYIVPLVYFFAEYQIRVQAEALAPKPAAAEPAPAAAGDPGKVLAFKKPEVKPEDGGSS